MTDSTYVITIVVKNVAQGDVIDLARRIWDEFDASLGDFAIGVARDGKFDIGWNPHDS